MIEYITWLCFGEIIGRYSWIWASDDQIFRCLSFWEFWKI